MKDELGGKIMREFAALIPKICCYLMDDGNSDKEVCHKKILKFNDYKDFLLSNEIILKSQRRFKSEAHKVYT